MKRINVTEPFLPPLEEYVAHLKGIWERNQLTNHGPLVRELEEKLRLYHQIQIPVHCVANGSLGLQIAMKALGVSGEVITTPFSYVATTACPLWEGCSVRFADIEPDTMTIDPQAVEAAITPKTEAILATHVFGNPCDVEALGLIAHKHGIALIYDAAHAFGVRYKDKSILEYGDVSMVSHHATKLFHTVEGGFVVSKDVHVSEKIEWMRRFGHLGEEAFYGVGINAKLSELHAAMGLCNLDHIEGILGKRRRVCDIYDSALTDLYTNGKLSTLSYRTGATRNYAYYPIFFEDEPSLILSQQKLQSQHIYCRRYFHPSLDIIGLPNAIGSCEISRSFAAKVVCLPLSASYTDEQIQWVADSLSHAMTHRS